jgi:hypothetical protein
MTGEQISSESDAMMEETAEFVYITTLIYKA